MLSLEFFLDHLDRICCGFFGKNFVVLCTIPEGPVLLPMQNFLGGNLIPEGPVLDPEEVRFS